MRQSAWLLVVGVVLAAPVRAEGLLEARPAQPGSFSATWAEAVAGQFRSLVVTSADLRILPVVAVARSSPQDPGWPTLVTSVLPPGVEAWGSRALLPGLEIERLRFRDGAAALRAFAEWTRVKNPPEPLLVEVRGDQLIMIRGRVLADPDPARIRRQAAWDGGIPSPPGKPLAFALILSQGERLLTAAPGLDLTRNLEQARRTAQDLARRGTPGFSADSSGARADLGGGQQREFGGDPEQGAWETSSGSAEGKGLLGEHLAKLLMDNDRLGKEQEEPAEVASEVASAPRAGGRRYDWGSGSSYTPRPQPEASDAGQGHGLLSKATRSEDRVDEEPLPVESARDELSADAPAPPGPELPADQEELLERLVLAEAGGEGELGMALVARSVLNRAALIQSGAIEAGTYNARGGSLSQVIYARGQYQPVSDGSLRRRRSAEELAAARRAIALARDTDALRARLRARGLDEAAIGRLLSATGFRTPTAFNDRSQNFARQRLGGHVFNGDRFSTREDVTGAFERTWGGGASAGAARRGSSGAPNGGLVGALPIGRR